MKRLEEFLEKIKSRANHYIGYPAGTDYDYKELYPLLDYSLNNVGDPYGKSNDMNSKEFEREVIEFYADYFNAPKNNYWGYVTNGGSEGNLYALYLARELYPNGMVYYSETTHYSIQKNIHLLNMDSIVIRSQANGEMDYDDLAETLQLNRHRSVIILANIGTTMTDAGVVTVISSTSPFPRPKRQSSLDQPLVPLLLAERARTGGKAKAKAKTRATRVRERGKARIRMVANRTKSFGVKSSSREAACTTLASTLTSLRTSLPKSPSYSCTPMWPSLMVGSIQTSKPCSRARSQKR
jgi:hypothetical protein